MNELLYWLFCEFYETNVITFFRGVEAAEAVSTSVAVRLFFVPSKSLGLKTFCPGQADRLDLASDTAANATANIAANVARNTALLLLPFYDLQ